MRGPSYIWKRGSSFFFQFAIPTDLIPVLGRTPFRSRMPVSDRRSALKVARVLAIGVEAKPMGKFDRLGKRGGVPEPDRTTIAADIDREIRELHETLLDIESAPDKPDRRTKEGQLEYERRRSDALSAALRAMTSRALGIAADWETDIRKANRKLASRQDELTNLHAFVGDLGHEVELQQEAIIRKGEKVDELVARRAGDETLAKIVTDFIGRNE